MTPVRYSAVHRWLAFRRGIPWALLILGCTLSVAAATYVASSSGAQMRSRFVADTEKMSSEIQLRLSSSVDVVRATAAILTANTEIHAVEFRDFVKALRLPSQYPGMKGIGFARVVVRPNLASYLRITSLDGNALRLRPAGVRPLYILVEVLEPAEGANTRVVGFDLLTDVAARTAVERARDTGQPAISDNVALTQDVTADAAGTRLLLVPIYHREAPVQTVLQRRRALVGFVMSTVAVGELMDAVQTANPSVHFSLYEGREATSDALRYSSGTVSSADGFQAMESVMVGGQPWLIAFTQTASQSDALAQSARTTLGAGLLLSILLFGFTRLQARAWTINAKHQSDLQQMALHDGLTGLANRALLEDHLPQAIAAAERRQRRLAVMFLDLDRFKEINDSLGHAAGDELLRSVATRLQACVRKSDTVSRHGGDEFVVLLTDIDQVDHAADRAQEIITAIGMPHRLGAHTVETSVSVGVSIYPDDGRQPTALLLAADAAMYQAKERGRNLCQFCTPEMNARAAARERIESGLRRALSTGELELHYQPTIALESGMITGLEALVRWRDPIRGLLSPTEFVPIAEETGLIVQLGRWALRQACRQAQAWSEEGLPVTVAVNVSAVELRAKGFLDNARAILRETGLDPHRLELELTESVLMQRAPSTVDVLQSLRALGVTIAIDDFGTGYSSVTYLRQFPIDVLKVDQSFVRDIPLSPDATPIVSAMISMGQSLGHRVIAEGVETPEQHAFLLARQCGEGQGFYFSRPLPPEQMGASMMAGASGVYLKM